jgi:hypothetical protein
LLKIRVICPAGTFSGPTFVQLFSSNLISTQVPSTPSQSGGSGVDVFVAVAVGGTGVFVAVGGTDVNVAVAGAGVMAG